MSRKQQKKSIRFEHPAPRAQSASLAGTFNDWSTESLPMTMDDKGVWSVAVELPQGRYELKFFVDGQWCCGPDCDSRNHECSQCVVNEYRTMNRVTDVE